MDNENINENTESVENTAPVNVPAEDLPAEDMPAVPDSAVKTDAEKDDAGAEKDAPGPDSFGMKVASFAYDTVSIVISAVAVIMVLFTFLFRIVGVSGTSMIDTLHDNDWLVVTPYYSDPQPLDIVIITQPNFFNEPLVKRVIAVEGEKVYIDHATGLVYVNDEPLDEPYTYTLTTESVTDEYDWPITVPEGCVFCMGDNRNGSTDSRSRLVGMIDKNYLLGCAKVRFIPFGNWDIYATTPKA